MDNKITVYNHKNFQIRGCLNHNWVGSFMYQYGGYYYTEQLIKYGVDISHNTPTITLFNFGVVSDYRNNGIGSQMLRYFFDGVMRLGDVVVLDCYEERVNFYKRNGFKVAYNEKGIFTMYYKKL